MRRSVTARLASDIPVASSDRCVAAEAHPIRMVQASSVECKFPNLILCRKNTTVPTSRSAVAGADGLDDRGNDWRSRMFETLDAKADGAVGQLTLNRPAKLNPLSTTALRELAAAASWFDEQAKVKVVIVRGAGRAFSAGADLSAFDGPQEGSPREAAERGREMAEALENMRAVSIAAIQGWCIGGGLVLAAACDLRVATEGARFAIPEVDLGIPLAWGGIPRLVREIGPALTKELVLTCRPFDAHEARAAGFLNRVVPDAELDASVQALADSLASKASLALFSTKRHVNAVTEQMVGTMRSWSDADGLVTALGDAECTAARREYLRTRRRK